MSSAASSAQVSLTLHGVSLGLTSELVAFCRYVEATMRPFLSDRGGESVRIDSKLEWVEGAPPRDLERAFGARSWDRRPDRDLYLAGTTAYWLRIDDFEDLQLALTWESGRLNVRGRYYFRLGRGRGEAVRKLLYRGRMEQLRARRFSTLLYYLVYHPILWLLSREHGWHLLHGGAVASPHGAALFGGMPGCGKSTLAVAMTADPQWRLLSDNLVLHGADRVLACPELLLLDARSLARVGAAAGRLQSTGERRVYERNAYRPEAMVLEPVRPIAIFHVERGRTSALEEVSAAACARRLAADSGMAKEVRRALLMAQVLDMVAGTDAPDAAADLAVLTAGVRCYTLRVAEDSALSEVIERYVSPALVDPRAQSRRHRA